MDSFKLETSILIFQLIFEPLPNIQAINLIEYLNFHKKPKQ